ncbi:hypothetical protein [Bradyrhizobium canariense]|uniref:hypothetical protein n=1 Tax=Bradyrhizobium canariense TaxID=255045 RepID=UPI001B8A1772|nr:hypothetical protein [Bradyrhizobium canariense]MBR0955232.1 hypothetical protein [Bradyrhizobium canariense]
MFAKRRFVRLSNGTELKTPILLPSFSSKGFPKVQKILKACEEYIADQVLVSAYDISYGLLLPELDFASAIFLDSGGYEASKDSDLSEIYEGDHSPREWSPEKYDDVVRNWSSLSPTIFTSFDHPKYRVDTKDQIERARRLPIPLGEHARSILFKPEGEKGIRLHLDRVTPHLGKLREFAIVGVTEKEIGDSILNRMANVARLRKALDRHHPDLPIHIFGSLDTISTYLFFLAGADIFDGLTWLRYAFADGDTVYRHSFGALKMPISMNSDIVEGCCWSNNYQYMQQMRLNMSKHVNDSEFEHFGKHSELIRSAYQAMCAEIAGD